jgi:glycosyltransferase involved in cell wall biosynthesis
LIGVDVALLSMGYPPYFNFGGSETYVKLLSQELIKNGVNVTVIAGWSRREVRVENEQKGLKIIRLPVIDIPIRTFWFQLINSNKILTLLQNVDVVHCNNLIASLFNKKIMKSKPLLVSVHGSLDSLKSYLFALRKNSLSASDLFYLMEYPLLRELYIKDLLDSNSLIFISKHGYTEALNYLGKNSSVIHSKSTVVYPGINFDSSNFMIAGSPRRRNDRLEVGYVGRLFWPKGVTYALEAFDILVNKMDEKNALLHIMGDGPLRSWITHYVKNSKLEKNVRIHGQVHREFVLQTLSNCTAILHPSLYEGCPFVLMEANSLGVPMVSFDFAWSREFIVNGLNGYISPPFDSQKLAENVLKAANLNQSLVREEAKKFDIRVTAKKTIEVYKKLL